MSKRLYIMRHAKAATDPHDNDANRPLSERGKEAAAKMAEWFGTQGFTCDQALVSAATRTSQSWEIVSSAVQAGSSETHEELYLASLNDLMMTIQAQADTINSLMIVGHNPGLYELAMTLSSHPELTHGFPTCAVAIIDFDAESWGLIGAGDGALSHYWTPKQGEII